MRKTICLLTVMLLGTLSISGCLDVLSPNETSLYSIWLDLDHANSAIDISTLGLDDDSIANITTASFYVEVSMTDISHPGITKTRYDVDIVDGKLVAKTSKGVYVVVERISEYRFEVEYSISSNDPDIKGLELIGGPDSDNKVSGKCRPRRIDGFNMDDWLVIEDIASSDGDVTTVPRSERSNAGVNYVVTMVPHDLRVIFDFKAG